MFLTRLSNLTSDESSSSGGVDLVVPVLSSDDNAVVADVVALVADDENLGGCNTAERLVAVGIAKGNDCEGSESGLCK